MQLDIISIKSYLDQSLIEDLGIRGDVTSQATVHPGVKCNFSITTREEIVVCGTSIAQYFLNNYSDASYSLIRTDGEIAKPNEKIISGHANAHDILKLERVMLNYIQHMSGIATLTHKYSTCINKALLDFGINIPTKLCDTRKTIPGLRRIQKYAVTCGNGHNHRLALDSSIMIKDNHIILAGNIEEAIKKAKIHTPHYAKIEIECDTLEQVKVSLNEGVDIIMLDNMSNTDLAEAISLIRKKSPHTLIEVSGGVSLENLPNIVKLGVDLISTSKLTTSAPAADIGLDIESIHN